MSFRFSLKVSAEILVLCEVFSGADQRKKSLFPARSLSNAVLRVLCLCVLSPKQMVGDLEGKDYALFFLSTEHFLVCAQFLSWRRVKNSPTMIALLLYLFIEQVFVKIDNAFINL